MKIKRTTTPVPYWEWGLTFMMKCFMFLSCVLVFGFNPGTSLSQNAEILIAKDTTMSVDGIFKQISHQTDYKFIYFEDLFRNAPELSLQKGRVSVRELLDKALAYGSFEVNFLGSSKTVLNIERKNHQYFVRGKVIDKEGNPLMGVTVAVKEKKEGTFTDDRGNYEIVVDPGEILVFSYMGYKTQEIAVSRPLHDMILLEDIDQLDEVVLIGYGAQKKKEVTGAISSVKVSDMEQLAIGVAGFDRALGGLAKGVYVTQGTGRPGAPARINIRGLTSPLSGSLNQPLYVIDGVPFNIDALPGTYTGGSNPLLAINPGDIESVDILKDAAATSIYGSRGANGVIIVTTKKGRGASKPTVDIGYNATFAQPVNIIGGLNNREFRSYYDRIMTNSVDALNNGYIYLDGGLLNFGQFDIDPQTGTYRYDGLREEAFGDENTDWNDLVFRDFALTQQVIANITGGTQGTTYIIGLSAMDQEGLLIKDKFNQYNLRFNIQNQLSDVVNTGLTFNGGYNRSRSGEASHNTNRGAFWGAVTARPDLPYRDAQGNLVALPDYTYGLETGNPSPLATLEHSNSRKSYNLIGNAFVEAEPVKNLTLKADLNAAVFINENSVFEPKIAMINFGYAPRSTLSTSENNSSNITTNLTANYGFNLGAHRFNALVGYSWDRTRYNTTRHYYRGFPDDRVLTNVSAAEEVVSYNREQIENGINSLFSRLTYSYKDRYNLTVNFRSDASSKFGPGNKRAYFPSLSAGWNIARESFIPDDSVLSNMQLRVSLGRVGSANITDFAYLQFFSTGSSDLYGGNTAVVPSDVLPNQKIGWETTEEINLGLDFGFFDQRIQGSFDLYSRKTTGALAPTPVPLELGPATYYSNLMDVSNSGVEISLNTDIIRNDDFGWSLNLNWSLNRNKLDALNGAYISDSDAFVIGKPVGTLMGYQVEKIIQTRAEADQLNAGAPDGIYNRQAMGVGDYMYRDINGDGEITTDDRTVIGSIQPDFYGGFSNVFRYKNLSLNTFFQYSVGAEASWDMLTFQSGIYLGPNYPRAFAMDSWTPDHPDARFARATYQDPAGNSRQSDRYIYDSSYLRLRNIQLSYSLPAKFAERMGVSAGTVYVSGTNLWTLTNWPGSDPETFGESPMPSVTDANRNTDPYPLAKSVSLGFNLKF